jgi:predicted amidophosphoribosyltransferase
MTRPLEKNRGPRMRVLRWLAEHQNYGRCSECRRWRNLLRGRCGECWRKVEVAS